MFIVSLPGKRNTNNVLGQHEHVALCELCVSAVNFKMLIHNFLENSAARFPDKVAIIHDQTRATYRQVNTDADSLASFLIGKGVEKGDRVVILLENGYEYVVAYYAILKAGAVAVPLSTDLKPDGLNPLLAELEPAAIISSSRFERLLQASHLAVPNLNTLVIHNPKLKWDSLPIKVYSFQQITNLLRLQKNWIAAQDRGGSEFQPAGILEYVEDLEGFSNKDIEPVDIFVTSDDLASIIYTSGSTGTPKGAMLSHGNIVANTTAIVDFFHLGPQDIHMVVLPFFYVMGKSLLNTHVAAGGTLVINNRFAYPAAVIKQMADEKVTGFSGVPSTYAYLLHRSPIREYKNKLNALRFCAQAGGHMARTLKLALRDILPDHTKLYIMYGATEGSARFTFLEPEQFENKIDSIGKPLSGVCITILNNKGCEVKPGQTGELNASGPNVMSGYWKDAQASARVLGAHGYRTGDMGYIDGDGYLYITGRKDDMVKVGGHRVNTQEVEDLLLATEFFVETAVFGLEDDLLGHRLKALIVPRDKTTDEQAVQKACSETMPKHKIPSEFIPVTAIPKKANGKTDRTKCLKIISSFRN